MSESEPRPRPQFGEYASAEEQRARIARPEVTDALSAGMRPPGSGAPAPAGRPARVPAASGARRADRVGTIALLLYGLFNVLLTVPRLFDFPTFANEYLELLGADGTFTNTAAADVWGPVAAVVYIAGWVATALVSWRMLQRGRIAFWVPLVGAVVTTSIVAACVAVPLSADPAFLALIEGFAPR
ncbi:DUF6264 family protein [Microbacterium sp. RD1]|uniref:DUF6264 family protein n=1 Tax=Microbacterium sp. RD1 TaxID=3457313 RepID=UPI003FA537C4